MSIQMPNQYDCNNMERGDVVYVRKRNIIYRIIRKFFLKDKHKIKVVMDWNKPEVKQYFYQEDCTLIYAYELLCTKSYKDTVPCVVTRSKNNKVFTAFLIHRLEVSLYNLQITLKNNLSFIIPLNYIQNAMEANKRKLDVINNDKRIQENLKFIRYKGDYFKNYVKENNIETWIPQYCVLCGNPITFIFNEEDVNIENKCNCKTMTLNKTKMSYNEFAVWYASQVDPHTKEHYDKFWLRKDKDKS